MTLEALEPRCAPGSLLGGVELLPAAADPLVADSFLQGSELPGPVLSPGKARSQKTARRLSVLEALEVLQRRIERLLREIRPRLERLGLSSGQLPRADQVVQKLTGDSALLTRLRQGKRFFLRAGWKRGSSLRLEFQAWFEDAPQRRYSASFLFGAAGVAAARSAPGPGTPQARSGDGSPPPGDPGTNQPPWAEDDYYSVLHDQTLSDPAPGVLWNDFDPEGDPLTAQLVTAPQNGSVTLNPDGSFTYEPDPGFAGQDSFTYQAHDGTQESSPATVWIDVVNNPPQAVDDEYNILFNPVNQQVLLQVTENDFDVDGDDLSIVSVDPLSTEGEITVAADGKGIEYKLPLTNGTDVEHGGESYLQDLPTNTDPPGEGEGGFERFQEIFSYTIADTIGAQSTAQVLVVMQNNPQWKVRLLRRYDEAKEIGIDGKPGHWLKIRKTFGENAPNLTAPRGTQLWQRNEQYLEFIFIDTKGEVKMEKDDRILADTNNIRFGTRTPLRITDTIGLKTKANVAQVAAILEKVEKVGGFNKEGVTPPVPQQQPWKVTREDHKQLLMQMNPKYGTVRLSTRYIYLNKPLLENLHRSRKLPTEKLQSIKDSLKQNFGFNYDSLPDIFEYYKLAPLGEWRYPE